MKTNNLILLLMAIVFSTIVCAENYTYYSGNPQFNFWDERDYPIENIDIAMNNAGPMYAAYLYNGALYSLSNNYMNNAYGTLFKFNATNISKVIDSVNNQYMHAYGYNFAIADNYLYSSTNMTGITKYNLNNLSDYISVKVPTGYAQYGLPFIYNDSYYVGTMNGVLRLNVSNLSQIQDLISLPGESSYGSIKGISGGSVIYIGQKVYQLNVNNFSKIIASVNAYNTATIRFDDERLFYSNFSWDYNYTLFSVNVSNISQVFATKQVIQYGDSYSKNLVISKDKQFIYFTDDKYLYKLNYYTLEEITKVELPSGGVMGITLSSNGNYLYVPIDGPYFGKGDINYLMHYDSNLNMISNLTSLNYLSAVTVSNDYIYFGSMASSKPIIDYEMYQLPVDLINSIHLQSDKVSTFARNQKVEIQLNVLDTLSLPLSYSIDDNVNFEIDSSGKITNKTSMDYMVSKKFNPIVSITNGKYVQRYILTINIISDILGTIEDPYPIKNCNELAMLNNNLSSFYELVNDIDCSETVNWNNGKGWTPIGGQDGQGNAPPPKVFSGVLNGNYHKISNIYINDANLNYAGLFGYVGDNGAVYNLRLDGITISANTYIGSLSGRFGFGIIENVSSTNINLDAKGGYQNGVGGLIGFINKPINFVGPQKISNVFVTGKINALVFNVGGLIGVMGAAGNSTLQINNTYADVDMTYNASYDNGGLVGYLGVGKIYNSFSTGTMKPKSSTDDNMFNPTSYQQTHGSGGIFGGDGRGNVIVVNTFTTMNIINNPATRNITAKNGAFASYYYGWYPDQPRLFVNDYYYNGSERDITAGNMNQTALNLDQTIKYKGNGFKDGGVYGISDLSYFYNKSNEPMNTWDFENTWVEIPGSYPMLKWYVDCVKQNPAHIDFVGYNGQISANTIALHVASDSQTDLTIQLFKDGELIDEATKENTQSFNYYNDNLVVGNYVAKAISGSNIKTKLINVGLDFTYNGTAAETTNAEVTRSVSNSRIKLGSTFDVSYAISNVVGSWGVVLEDSINGQVLHDSFTSPLSERTYQYTASALGTQNFFGNYTFSGNVISSTKDILGTSSIEVCNDECVVDEIGCSNDTTQTFSCVLNLPCLEKRYTLCASGLVCVSGTCIDNTTLEINCNTLVDDVLTKATSWKIEPNNNTKVNLLDSIVSWANVC